MTAGSPMRGFELIDVAAGQNALATDHAVCG
jgi:hypothetical protein